MKKAFVVLFVAAGMAFGLTSCKGDYTCSCTYDLNTGSGDSTITQDFPYNGVKKSDAEEACDLQDTQIKIIDQNGTCTLD